MVDPRRDHLRNSPNSGTLRGGFCDAARIPRLSAFLEACTHGYHRNLDTGQPLTVAAVAPVGGTMAISDYKPKRPVPVATKSSATNSSRARTTAASVIRRRTGSLFEIVAGIGQPMVRSHVQAISSNAGPLRTKATKRPSALMLALRLARLPCADDGLEKAADFGLNDALTQGAVSYRNPSPGFLLAFS